MLRAAAGDIRRRIRLQLFGDLGVQALAAQRRQARQQMLAQQAVGELVTRTAVRRDQNTLVGGLVQVVGQGVQVQPGGGGEQCDRRAVEDVPDDSRGPKHLQHSRIQAREPAVEYRLDRRWDIPAGAFRTRQTRVLRDEERVATRAFGQHDGLRVGDAGHFLENLGAQTSAALSAGTSMRRLRSPRASVPSSRSRPGGFSPSRTVTITVTGWSRRTPAT